MPIELNEELYQKEVLKGDKPSIIKVHASWCGPCLQMVPIFSELEKEYQDRVKFFELNVDQARDLAITFGISSIPTTIFIKDGKVASKEVGFIDKPDLKNKIEEFIK